MMALAGLTGRADLWEHNQRLLADLANLQGGARHLSPALYYNVGEMQAEMKALLMSLALRLCDFFRAHCPRN